MAMERKRGPARGRAGDSRHLDWIDPEKEDGHRANPEAIYALGNEGARYVAERCGHEYPKLRRTELNRKIKQVAHTMLVSDIMVAIELACRQRPETRLMHAREMLARAPREKQESKRPLSITTVIPTNDGKKERTICPDGFFGLVTAAKPDRRKRFYFFLEADRSTMTQQPANTDYRSIFEKFQVYYEWWRKGGQRDDFDIPDFRVLFVTGKSRERYYEMIGRNRAIHENGWPHFLFAYSRDLLSAPDILAAPWLDGEEDATTMLPVTGV
jgi:hypothetical protein